MDNEPKLQIVNIATLKDRLEEYKTLLSEAEVQRSKRFASNSLIDDFCAIHGALRVELGRWLSIPPKEVSITYTEYGKPYLENPPFPLYFNISHSGEYVVFAFSRTGDIGVDIEKIDPKNIKKGMEKLIFSEKELAFFNNLPFDQKIEAFYRAWTQKEAILKADGRGLLGDVISLELPQKSQEMSILEFMGRTFKTHTKNYGQTYLISVSSIV